MSLAACVHAPKTPAPPAAQAVAPPPCLAEHERATAELVFGRVSGSTLGPGVSEAQFSRFLSAEIAPRFPDGLTVLDAQDLEPKPAGTQLYGPSKVVMIVLPGHADDAAQLDAIRKAYGSEFNQKTVLEMTRSDCVTY
jgi:hypothetical protein